MRIYNTQTKTKELFSPINSPNVNLFVCGPTVYDNPHIGHARVYVVFDAFAKFLKQIGYKVFYIQNITDIDDKIIKKAQEEGVSFKDISKKYEQAYFEAMQNLKVSAVDNYLRATEHIREIISQVERLVEKGFAYIAEDGVYFDISKFPDYGKLSGRRDFESEDAVSRIDESASKRNKGDFALWKISKPHEPFWESPWGKGRPGWHIEDTAITEKYFGPQYDIHGGGRDLIFPHHEAELTQMEALSGKSPFVRYWMHVGFLQIKGEKMSKSLGNFITIQDFIQKYGARVLRYFILKSHYRSPIDFEDKLIGQSIKELEKIDDFIERLNSIAKSDTKDDVKYVNELEKNVRLALEDDFNTPKALGYIFDFINEFHNKMNKEELSRETAEKITKTFKDFNNIFEFIFWESEEVPPEIMELVEVREQLRKQGEWEKADKIRQEIQERGYIIKDTEKGPLVRKRIF